MIKYFSWGMFFVSIFSFCTNKIEDVPEFEKSIEIVKEYDRYIGVVDDTLVSRFYFATEYLTRITKIKASFVIADVPYYKSKKDCDEDIKKWEDWYSLNGHKLTKHESDIILHEITKENIWWKDSSILNYVFGN